MLEALRQLASLVRQYGVGPCAFRLGYNLRRKTGLLKRRFPRWSWSDRPLEAWLSPAVPADPPAYRQFRQRHGATFFFPLGEPPSPARPWVEDAVQEADKLTSGTFRYFSHAWGELGHPEPNWRLNPFLGRSAVEGRHWCDAGDFDPRQGDIKFIWEPSRFGWAYALARAYAATGEDRHPETFWRLVSSWMAANPPNTAPHYQCGQEVAIRLMACAFALHAFWASPASTDERIASLVVLLAALAERIEGNINFAIQQRSNHAATEAAGVYTAGILFPELRAAGRWRQLGKRVLEEEAERHNWPDGSYVQHSMNYQRMTLSSYLWCLRLAELNGDAFSDLTRQRIERSYQFLYEVQDGRTGWTPNYGANDGARILPLDGCAYPDFRPVVGAAHYLFARGRLYESGPWDEPLLWLFGPEALEAQIQPLPRVSRSFDHGGYYTIRGGSSWAMLRCHTHRIRPGQADMLHLDLWWRGVNILRDSGTFSYYDPDGQWNAYFLSTAAHNAVVLAGRDQMIKGRRFQWYALVRSKLLGRWRQGDRVEAIAGEHYGYRRLACKATHRRAVCRLGKANWLIVDDVLGAGAEQVRLFWHLVDGPAELEGCAVRLTTDAGLTQLTVASTDPQVHLRLARGQDGGERMGWQSLHYGQRTAAPTLCAESRQPLPVRFVTLLSLGAESALAECDLNGMLAWTSPEAAEPCRVQLAPVSPALLMIRWIEVGGQRLAFQRNDAGQGPAAPWSQP